MKLLLTSAGIKNPSIHNALLDLLGKAIAESSALCIPTAGYGHPQGSPGGAWRFISGRSAQPMCELVVNHSDFDDLAFCCYPVPTTSRRSR